MWRGEGKPQHLGLVGLGVASPAGAGGRTMVEALALPPGHDSCLTLSFESPYAIGEPLSLLD